MGNVMIFKVIILLVSWQLFVGILVSWQLFVGMSITRSSITHEIYNLIFELKS